MDFLFVKAIHIIAVVAWFAGLFYLVRLFIYHREALERPEPEKSILANQFSLMEGRLWRIITLPAAALTLVSGPTLAVGLFGWEFLSPTRWPGWFLGKNLFIVGLVYYNWVCYRIMVEFADSGTTRWSSAALRMWNEVATLILTGTVFLVVFKGAIHWGWAIGGMALFTLLIALGMLAYRRFGGGRPTTP